LRAEIVLRDDGRYRVEEEPRIPDGEVEIASAVRGDGPHVPGILQELGCLRSQSYGHVGGLLRPRLGHPHRNSARKVAVGGVWRQGDLDFDFTVAKRRTGFLDDPLDLALELQKLQTWPDLGQTR